MIDVTVDISVFDRIKKRVSDLNTKDILRDVANAVYVHLSERVHVKGKATDGTKIGKDIYVKYGPKPYQVRSRDNLSISKCGYVGTISNTSLSKARSLVDLMNQLSFLKNLD